MNKFDPKDEALNEGLAMRERIIDEIESAIFLEPNTFDEAIIGVAYRFGIDPVVAYDRTIVIDILAREMTREEAEEFFEFNTIGAWMGDLTPVFIEITQTKLDKFILQPKERNHES
jgi:hypothetical protein